MENTADFQSEHPPQRRPATSFRTPTSKTSTPLHHNNPHLAAVMAKKQPVRVKPNSVRFDPNVTKIHANQTPKSPPKMKTFPTFQRDIRAASMCEPQRQQRFGHYDVVPSFSSPPAGVAPKAQFSTSSRSNTPDVVLSFYPPLHTSSQLSLDDDSDLNTTTSGSYSVASDDVARVTGVADVKDLYV